MYKIKYLFKPKNEVREIKTNDLKEFEYLIYLANQEMEKFEILELVK